MLLVLYALQLLGWSIGVVRPSTSILILKPWNVVQVSPKCKSEAHTMSDWVEQKLISDRY